MEQKDSIDNEWLKKVGQHFATFVSTIARLRHPTQGCPWDVKQDHESLRRYMLEEAYEASAALASQDEDLIAEELGDVLLQVVLNAQVGKDQKKFSILDVIEAINSKMLRRHPHVFKKDPHDSERIDSLRSDKDHRRQWDSLKGKEKAPGSNPPTFEEAFGLFPSTIQAWKIGRIAEKIDFDWDCSQAVFGQLKSEIDELEVELVSDSSDKSKISDELGDVFFTLAQLCRHLGIDPEVAAQDGNRKFLNRFATVEQLAVQRGIDIKTASIETKEKLWRDAKRAEVQNALAKEKSD
jgi:MazG family protein